MPGRPEAFSRKLVDSIPGLNMTRRALVLASAAASQLKAAAPRNIPISSENGRRACVRAAEMLQTGNDTLDAVIAGVNINEEDPEDTSVGYGGLGNEEGVTELDGSVMHGATRRCGAIGGMRGCRTPSKIAKLVMEQSDHIMLVGEGADRFARAC